MAGWHGNGTWPFHEGVGVAARGAVRHVGWQGYQQLEEENSGWNFWQTEPAERDSGRGASWLQID